MSIKVKEEIFEVGICHNMKLMNMMSGKSGISGISGFPQKVREKSGNLDKSQGKSGN